VEMLLLEVHAPVEVLLHSPVDHAPDGLDCLREGVVPREVLVAVDELAHFDHGDRLAAGGV
jgi:hypothetical protein